MLDIKNGVNAITLLGAHKITKDIMDDIVARIGKNIL